MNVSDVEECLIEQVGFEEAEARESGASSSEAPFGLIQKEWVELITQMEPDDELWSFSTLRGNSGKNYTVLADGYILRRGR